MTIKPGALRFNTDSMKLEIFRGSANYEGSASMAGIGTLAAGQWEEIQATSPDVQTGGTRGVIMGGRTPSNSNEIDYINIATTGNATNFGTLATAGRGFANGQTASRVRGLAMGGNPSDLLPDVQSITIASEGTATEHASILTIGRRLCAGASSSTRALVAGGLNPSVHNIIDATDIASLGNAIDFGDTALATFYRAGLSSSTRGVFTVAYDSSSTTTTNAIEFVTISTQGNAADFGDLTQATMGQGAGGNSTRGIFYGGGLTAPSFPNTNVISYITIGTLGNAQDFGDATQSVEYAAVASSPTRLVTMGGSVDPSFVNTMAYVQIPSTGDAIDFGDLANTARQRGAGVSNGHGGL